jgi:hypothetical protein
MNPRFQISLARGRGRGRMHNCCFMGDMRSCLPIYWPVRFVSQPWFELFELSRRSTGAGSDERLGMGPNVVVCNLWTFSSID